MKLFFCLIFFIKVLVFSCNRYCSDCQSCNDGIGLLTLGQKICLDMDIIAIKGGGHCVTNNAITGRSFSCNGFKMSKETDMVAVRAFYLVGISNVEISDCEFSFFNRDIFITTGNNLTISNSISKNSDSDSFWLDGVTNSYIKNITIIKASTAMKLRYSEDNIFEDIVVYSSRGSCYSFYNSKNNVIKNNDLFSCQTSVSSILNSLNNSIYSTKMCQNKDNFYIDESSSLVGNNNTCNNLTNQMCNYDCPPAKKICYCDSCQTCEDMSIQNCEVVYLTKDIYTNGTESCIDVPNVFNKVFDCQNFIIENLSEEKSLSTSGIYFIQIENITVQNCIIKNYYTGIRLNFPDEKDSVINITAYNNKYGIYFSTPSGSRIIDSKTYYSETRGIYSSYGTSVYITNTHSFGDAMGFYLYHTDAVYLDRNTIQHTVSGQGIYVIDSNYCHQSYIKNSYIYNISTDGMEFRCYNSTLENNVIRLTRNGDGIEFYRANLLKFSGNVISEVSSSHYGLRMVSSFFDSIVWNNIINCTNNILFPSNSHSNSFNLQVPIFQKNIIGGPFTSGNFWSEYSGIDENKDGFGDTQFNLTDVNIDYFPLIAVNSFIFITTKNVLPEASIMEYFEDIFEVNCSSNFIQWKLESGSSLPNGWKLTSDGILSGIPLEIGSYSFTIEASDNLGNSTSKEFFKDVSYSKLPLEIITKKELPETENGKNFTHNLTAVGGRYPYRFVLQSIQNNLLLNIKVSKKGKLTGCIHTIDGDFTVKFTVRVYDNTSINFYDKEFSKLIYIPQVPVTSPFDDFLKNYPVLIFISISLVAITCLLAISSAFILIVITKKNKKKTMKMKMKILGDDEKTPTDISKLPFKIDTSFFNIKIQDVEPISEIGHGATCIVYKAKWNKTSIVAFKLFQIPFYNENSTNDSVEIQSFIKETKILLSLIHPRIVQCFGCVLKYPRVGVLMEFCPDDLFTFTLKSKRKIEKKEQIFLQIGEGLSFLHSKKIIHRDIKPENILMNKGDIKITDFGLSRFMEKKSNLTKNIGTSQYQSPEVSLGLNYDFSVDVFSFVMLIIFVLNEKQFLYEKPSNVNFSIDMKVANDENYRPKIVNEDKLPKYLIKLIKKGWVADPEKRISMSDTLFVLKNKSFPENKIN